MPDEPLPHPCYVSVFTTHFLANPAQNSRILKRLYLDLGLSIRDIVNLTDSAWRKTSVLKALKAHGLSKREAGRRQRVRYGQRLVDGRLAPYPKEQKVISLILKWRSQGLSFTQITKNLNGKKIKSKKGGQWSEVVVTGIYRREQEERV